MDIHAWVLFHGDLGIILFDWNVGVERRLDTSSSPEYHTPTDCMIANGFFTQNERVFPAILANEAPK
jgi:hypothetical protein